MAGADLVLGLTLRYKCGLDSFYSLVDFLGRFSSLNAPLSAVTAGGRLTSLDVDVVSWRVPTWSDGCAVL